MNAMVTSRSLNYVLNSRSRVVLSSDCHARGNNIDKLVRAPSWPHLSRSRQVEASPKQAPEKRQRSGPCLAGRLKDQSRDQGQGGTGRDVGEDERDRFRPRSVGQSLRVFSGRFIPIWLLSSLSRSRTSKSNTQQQSTNSTTETHRRSLLIQQADPKPNQTNHHACSPRLSKGPVHRWTQRRCKGPAMEEVLC